MAQNNKQNIFESDVAELAKQLRKPQGELGIQVGEGMNVGNQAMNLHSIAVLNPGKNEHILEIGMGNGFFVKNILSLDSSITYVGCDYSQDMIAEASRINQDWITCGRAKFVEANVEKTEFKALSFDKIVTVNTIYFWENVAETLVHLKNLLKNKGELIISFRPEKNMRKFPVTAHGFAFYNSKKLSNMLVNAGFVSVEITEIKEPEEVLWDKKIVKEAVIIKAKKA